MLEYMPIKGKLRERYKNPRHLYVMVIRHGKQITETPVTDGYMRWLHSNGFNVPADWKAAQQELRIAA